jgi:hypothetical protein
MNIQKFTQMGKSSVGQALGINEMSDEELESFLSKIGSIVMQSATLRYMVELTERERNEFSKWLENNQDKENLVELAMEEYPAFTRILNEEVESFQQEAKKLL